MKQKAKPKSTFPKTLYVTRDQYSNKTHPVFFAGKSVEDMKWNGFNVEVETAIYELKKVGKMKVIFE